MQFIPPEEIARRRPVWQAMSAFFLDTELDEAQVREIAQVLRASGYSEAQLDDILTREIAPLLYSNAVSVAGVWNGFDLDWLVQQIVAGKHRTLAKWYRFTDRWACNRVLRGVKEQYWNRVVAGIRARSVGATIPPASGEE